MITITFQQFVLLLGIAGGCLGLILGWCLCSFVRDDPARQAANAQLGALQASQRMNEAAFKAMSEMNKDVIDTTVTEKRTSK